MVVYVYRYIQLLTTASLNLYLGAGTTQQPSREPLLLEFKRQASVTHKNKKGGDTKTNLHEPRWRIELLLAEQTLIMSTICRTTAQIGQICDFSRYFSRKGKNVVANATVLVAISSPALCVCVGHINLLTYSLCIKHSHAKKSASRDLPTF